MSMDFDGLPDDDEMQSSDDVNEAKKRKGRDPTMLDYNAVSKAKQIGVQFNDKGQHFGAGSASLSLSTGILARQLIPVTYASWDEVPTILKDKLWAAVKRNKGTPEEDLNRVNLWIAARTRKNGQPVNEIVSKKMDDIKLANEMSTTDNGSIKDDALSQALGPEHQGRLRGGGYGVTPSRYDAQTYASMSNRELRDRLQNVEGKLREVFDLVLAKQQNEGNGKQTNTNDAIQVSTNRPQVPNSNYQVSKSSPQIQCDRRSAREADDASRQASKASSQRSSPNIERDSITRKEGSKATSQLQPVGILRGSSCKLLNWLGNGQVVATGEIESTNPEAKVHHMVLGPDCWKVWVTVVRMENISLYRPTSEFRVLEDAISSTIAWPSKYVRVGE